MKNSTLIQRIADWLERKYFNRKTWSARARSAAPSGVWYSEIPSNDSAATPTINTRKGRKNQPSQMTEGTVPTRMLFS